MSKYLALILFVLLISCKPPVVITVPCPKPPEIVRPDLRIKKLRTESTTREVIEAYVLDLAEQVGYADQLESILSGYR
jgi:hypothetical protein